MKRYGLSFGILMMDIDHFKNFNDTYGHDTGDLVLKAVSKTLMTSARPFDLFGRWGGEEFVGIIRNVDTTGLAKIGNRCRVLVEDTQISADKFKVTMSIGASLARPDDTIQSLIKRADILLYESKGKGRNCITADQ